MDMDIIGITEDMVMVPIFVIVLQSLGREVGIGCVQ